MGSIKKSLIAMAVSSAIVATPISASARTNCEENLIETNRAIEGAMQSTLDARKAGVAFGVGGGCALFSLFLLGLDAGMTSLICTVATAGAVATLTVEERREIASQVFDRVRDKRCIK